MGPDHEPYESSPRPISLRSILISVFCLYVRLLSGIFAQDFNDRYVCILGVPEQNLVRCGSYENCVEAFPFCI